MIKKIMKPFRWLLGLDLLNDEIGKKSKVIESLQYKLDDALDENVSLSCSLKQKDEEIKALEVKTTMQTESLRKAAESIVKLKKEIEQLESPINAEPVAINAPQSFIYKVWITRDKTKNNNSDIEVWIKEPELLNTGCYSFKEFPDRLVSIDFPQSTFRRHNGFVPKKGQKLEGMMYLEVKR